VFLIPVKLTVWLIQTKKTRTYRVRHEDTTLAFCSLLSNGYKSTVMSFGACCLLSWTVFAWLDERPSYVTPRISQVVLGSSHSHLPAKNMQ